MTAPSLFRKWGKKEGSSKAVSSDSQHGTTPKVKPQLFLPKGLSRRRSNETYPDSSSVGDLSTSDSVVSLDANDELVRRAPNKTIKLQSRLDALVSSRNLYSTEIVSSLETAYYNKPTLLQQAS
jgi:hypothetical protein